MSAGPRQAGSPRARRRWPRRLLVIATAALALLLVLWLVAWIALPPERVVPMVLARLGASMNLEISADGDASSRLGRQPTFVVHNLVAREPGAMHPLLQARRVEIALPWRTIRSLGDTLDIARIELDAPVLHLPALQHWRATRPPGETRLPTLAEGLRVRGGEIGADRWRVEALAIDTGEFNPARPLRATTSGRYVDDALRMPFLLSATWTRPVAGRGLGIAGHVSPARGEWRLPTWITLSTVPSWEDGIRLLPMKLGASARYESGETSLPFALGLYGPVRAHADAWTLLPAGLALRGEGVVPAIDARGRLAYGRHLIASLDGRIEHWPRGWPALPPPLSDSRSPLRFTLDYAGAATLADPLQVRVARDDTRFDGRLRVPELVQWATAPRPVPLLPPLQGRLETPRIEVSGAQLEGIVIEFEDDAPSTGGQAP